MSINSQPSFKGQRAIDIGGDDVNKRRRRSLISAQGWSVSDNLGYTTHTHTSNPERVRRLRNPFRVLVHLWNVTQGSRTLEPWAAIGKRLRR